MDNPSADEYIHLSPRDHVLARGEMYIGSFSMEGRRVQIYDGKIRNKEVCGSPESLERLFLEILSNAQDNVQKSREGGYDPWRIEVKIGKDEIEIKSYGRWIPIEENSQTGLYAPEMVFGVLNTSSNYSSADTTYIGQNGIGAKAANVFSSNFSIECGDPSSGKKYSQSWNNNMSHRGDPKIVKYKGKRGYVTVRYSPDFGRFGKDEFNVDDIGIYSAHCISASFTCNIPIILNGEKINVRGVKEYANMIATEGPIICHNGDGYDIALSYMSNGGGENMLFVNGMPTPAGGVHLSAIQDCILGWLEKKGVKSKRGDISGKLMMILNCRLPSPKFKSQTKEYLTSPKPNISIPMKKLNEALGGLLEEAKALNRSRESAKLKKSDGKNTRKKIDDPVGTDANRAGKEPDKCTLILTEGLSALQYAERFLGLFSGSRGRDFYGTIPLQGVPLNAYNASFDKLAQNKEFSRIKKFLGLKDASERSGRRNERLRYGTIWIMADADNDGKHIAGLLLLFFMHRFPEIVERGMVKLFRTPVVRVTKGGRKKKFFTERAFERWLREGGGDRGWKYKYYKGLASSKKEDIKEDFLNINAVSMRRDEKDMESLMKAFDKTRADDRKMWLEEFVEEEAKDLEEEKEIEISDFIECEMVGHSFASVYRGIPRMDGFKEALRKAFYTSEKKLHGGEEIKVSHLASATSELCNYKYGEKSLGDAIASAAQQFVGSNNLSIFKPEGIIGSRTTGKNDSAPRYIYVSRNWWIPFIFRKEDDVLLERNKDEGKLVEPDRYYPILPTVLFNYSSGIATGFRSEIPGYNPEHLASWIKAWIRGGEGTPKLKPWFRDHTGDILEKSEGFVSRGRAIMRGGGIVDVEELPARMWTRDFERHLQNLKGEGVLEEYYQKGVDNKVSFMIEGWKPKDLDKLKLTKNISLKNLTILARNERGAIFPKRYSSIEDLLEDFSIERLRGYEVRREKNLHDMVEMEKKIRGRRKFIRLVTSGRLKIMDRSLEEIRAQMKEEDLSEEHLDKVSSRHYTKDEIRRLDAKISSIVEERRKLEETSAKDLWEREIDEFLEEYN